MKVLDFYADWCGPCQMLKPVIAEIEAVHPEVEFEAINIDEDPETAGKYGIMSIPTLVILDDEGGVKEMLVGLRPKAEIEKVIAE
ncbi:thioredoxin fold domain-containing protein [Candidatus Saccharibacteria bacterium]|nr:thioredoxin fold domain-containing protein [Candidatus Saccharibacteria bacterium]